MKKSTAALVKGAMKLRHALGSISLEEIKVLDEKMSKTERADYLRNAELVFKNPVFQNEIARIIREQEKFTAAMAETWEAVLVGRGTIHAAVLLEDRFAHLHLEYKAMIEPEDKDFDPHEIVNAE